MNVLLNILLKNIVKCSVEQQFQILEIRNQESIRNSMFTSHIIGVDEHKTWISNLAKDKKKIIFVILKNYRDPIGIVGLSDLDLHRKKTRWGFYLDEKERGRLSAIIEFKIIDYVFDEMNLEELKCYVLETNPNVVRMHIRFGFIDEGIKENYIERNNNIINIHNLLLKKEDWLKSRIITNK